MIVISKKNRFVQKIVHEAKRRCLLRRNDHVLLAVSGGADSMALLYVACAIREMFGARLTVAHLDHGLRKSSFRDLEFVKKQCQLLNMDCVVSRKKVSRVQGGKRYSLEDAARNARYRFLNRVANKVGARKIWVAHTQNDQAETVLLHLLRGSGIDGAAGMAWQAPLSVVPGGGSILQRPLLGVTRKEVERFLHQYHIPFRKDPSNKSQKLRRNQVRKHLIPILERYNTQVVKKLSHFSEILFLEKEFVQSEIDQAFQRCRMRGKEGTVSFCRGSFKRLPATLRQGVFRKALQMLKGDTKDITFQNWNLFCEWTKRKNRPGQLELPRGLIARQSPKRIYFERVFKQKKARSVMILKRESGQVTFNGTVIQYHLERHFTRPRNLKTPRNIAWVDAQKISYPLRIRSRKPGDRFVPFGMKRSKKVQDFLVDSKIPRENRDGIPIVMDRRRIIWVAGLRSANPVRITSSTTHVLKLSLHKA
jgi:tRNA(Ile)-lysidine synthase